MAATLEVNHELPSLGLWSHSFHPLRPSHSILCFCTGNYPGQGSNRQANVASIHIGRRRNCDRRCGCRWVISITRCSKAYRNVVRSCGPTCCSIRGITSRPFAAEPRVRLSFRYDPQMKMGSKQAANARGRSLIFGGCLGPD